MGLFLKATFVVVEFQVHVLGAIFLDTHSGEQIQSRRSAMFVCLTQDQSIGHVRFTAANQRHRIEAISIE